MIVRTETEGRFSVANACGDVIAGPFASNAEAWRWIDRQEGEPINPAEKKAEWIWSKIAENAR